MRSSDTNKLYLSWKFYHILFWIAIFFTFLLSGPRLAQCDFWWYCLDMLIGMVIVALLIYGNYYYLMKIYRRNKLLYILTAFISLVAFSYLYNLFTFASCNTNSGKISFERNNTLWGYFSRVSTGFRYLVISFLLKFVEDWYKQEKKLTQITVDKLAAELNYLKSQINPHFLFNTLNNLYGLALKKSDKTPQVIMHLSDIMSYMLYETNDAKIPLLKEIKNLSDYIELEKIRQGNKAEISFQVKGNLENLTIVPLLLLPIIENAFKHGINKVTENGFLNASVCVQESNLSFTVRNNSSDNNPSISNSHGLGLSNLEKRLNLFYENRYSLIISKTDTYHHVELKIKLDEI